MFAKVKVLQVLGVPALSKSGKSYWVRGLVQFAGAKAPMVVTFIGSEAKLADVQPNAEVDIRPSDIAFLEG